MAVVDLFMLYQFVKRLATPFKQWDAYKLGIIDEKGKVLKKRKDFTTGAEREAFGMFDVLVGNLKKILAKVPGGQTRLASYAAALLLLREQNNVNDKLIENLEERFDMIFEEVKGMHLSEDAPTMSTGPAIPGTGDDPVHWLDKKKQKKRKELASKVFKRQQPNA